MDTNVFRVLILLLGITSIQSYPGTVTYLNSSLGTTSGTILSTNYPDDYDDDLDLFWLITADAGDLVMIVTHFQDIHLPSNSASSCSDAVETADYLNFYDGDATTDTLLKTACDDNYDKTVTSSQENMLLHFSSDSNKNANGFLLRYYLKPDLCTAGTGVYPTGCRNHYLNGNTTNGWKCIENEDTILSVYCDYTTVLNSALTRLPHDQPNNITVDGEDYGDTKSWSVEFAYGNYTSPWDVKSGMEAQLMCYQYVAYDCLDSIMWNGNTEYATWRGPQATTLEMAYWGGAGVTESGKNCMCGEYDICTSGSSGKCHCDTDDDVWQRDAGWLIIKSKLPVSRLLYGDVEDDDELGFTQVGDLFCHQPLLDKSTLPTSCLDALETYDYDDDGFYLIDVDGADTGHNPFVVYCDFSTLENGVITKIGHDFEEETYINGYTSSKPFARTINYDHGLKYAQVREIVDNSIGCVTLQTFDCKGAGARTSDALYFHTYENVGDIAYNFGGGNSDSCPCNDLDSCFDTDEPCNCDADLTSSSPWRQDKGWFNDRTYLPIMQYNVEDTDDYREAYLTVGQLECYQNTSDILTNCYEYKEANYSTDGTYLVDPGDEDPFPVYCDIDYNATHVLMQLSHDAEDRTHVSGYEDPGTYQQMVTYDRMTYAQIQSLFEFQSKDYLMYCEQDLKYECRDSALLLGTNAWIVDRHGNAITTFSPTGDGLCPCGDDGTCAGGGNCNCDAKSGSWAEDDGTYPDDWATVLPITQLRYGDTAEGSGEGYHTLGKLNCYVSKGKIGKSGFPLCIR